MLSWEQIFDMIRNNYIPETISPEAQKILKEVYEKKIYEYSCPAPEDTSGWILLQKETEENYRAITEAVIEKNSVTLKEIKKGDVSVLEIQPEKIKDSSKVLVYIHGGAFTLFSARSTLNCSAPMCHSTGLRTIAVDYTNSPQADWNTIQEQVISVFKALLSEGYSMGNIYLFGDSAGGGIAANSVIRLRDSNMGMPSAVVLMSPWIDLTERGDTFHTLADSDPVLVYNPMLKNCAEAYADGLELNDPKVSAINADFSKGFPPVLITEGTKCIFLSSSVLFDRTLKYAGLESELDLYEGMWHVFQQHDIPESRISLKKCAEFFEKHSA